jgi:hypothetical protein
MQTNTNTEAVPVQVNGWKTLKSDIVLHRAVMAGPRIVKTEIIQSPEGRQFEISFWADDNGKVMNVRSVEIA